MPKGWTQVRVGRELFDAIEAYYESHKDELRLKQGVRSRSAFVVFTIREYCKEKDII